MHDSRADTTRSLEARGPTVADLERELMDDP